MFYDSNKILVAGGSGLVGSHLVARLRERGAHVRATYCSHAPNLRHADVDYVQANLTEMKECVKVVAGMDYVFLCAANTSGAATMAATPLVHVTPNILLNAQMLEACYHAGVKKVLWLSSTTGYPDTFDRPTREEDMMVGDPHDKYFPVGWMKRYTEVLCRMYSEKLPRKMPCLVLRPTNIFGPGDKFDPSKSHVLPALIRKVVERQQPLVVWGDGTDVRDFIYVDDMVEAMLLALERLDRFEPLNIGMGRSCTVKEVLALILEAEGSPRLDIVFDPTKPTMIPKRIVDCSRAKNLLGFEARVDLGEGIRRTIDWFKNTYRQPRHEKAA